MLISVIITTKNEENNIENCLKSIKEQTYSQDKIEIIVVDNNSKDSTKDIARAFTDKVFDKGPERSAQRNFGVEQATGEYILYLDADMILSQKVIEECADKVKENSDIVALYIPEIVMGDGFWSKVRRFERGFYDATVIDCVRFIKKYVFMEIGGFDETMSGPEDWDLDRRVREKGGAEIIFSALYHNEKGFDFKHYLSKKGYYAKSFDKYVEKHGKGDKEIKKQLGFYYRFIGVFVEKGKWKKLIAHPILTLGMYFLRFLVGVRYLMVKIF